MAVAKIAAVTSVPRLGWNDFWGSAFEALAHRGIPLRRHSGAFWEQGMQSMFNDCIREGVDWILTLDYDSTFTAEQLDRMLWWFGNNEHIDALAPLQIGRGREAPLFSKRGMQEVSFETSKPFRVDSAHFGLTLLRASAIATLPKPWFWGQPGADGDWGDDRVDADIYFWNKWYDAGLSVYVAPDVRIGHLQVMVSDYDKDFKPRHQYVGKWLKENSVVHDKEVVLAQREHVREEPADRPRASN